MAVATANSSACDRDWLSTRACANARGSNHPFALAGKANRERGRPTSRFQSKTNSNYLAPSTESLSAFAAVKRSRVRAGILIASPVAGLRPIRALLLRLRKIPSPANRSEPSFFNSRTTSAVTSSSAIFACFLVSPTFSARCAATCDCVIILLLVPVCGLPASLNQRFDYCKWRALENRVFSEQSCTFFNRSFIPSLCPNEILIGASVQPVRCAHFELYGRSTIKLDLQRSSS